MRRVLFLSCLVLVDVLHAESASTAVDCSINIKKVEHTPETYTLVLTHDPRCEILMDHSEIHIDLVSKSHDTGAAVEEDNTTSALTKVDQIISLAKSKLGDTYEAQKAGPDHFDCSGFVYYVFTNNGIDIPRSSLTQSEAGKKLGRDEIQKGDILFFDTHARGHINHSGIYLGDGKFIHSSSGKAYAVTISTLDKGFYLDKFRWGIRKMQ